MDPVQLFDQTHLSIQDCGAKGRGVVTKSFIPSRTLVDISPILLFPTEEYNTHGQFTQLDHYTYRWQGGMALALGLGSMFNHSKYPNVGFQRDFENKMIRYTTLRDIQSGEELCISYGPNLWFPDMEEEIDPTLAGADKDTSGSRRSSLSSLLSVTDGTAEEFLARLQFSDSEDDKEDLQKL
ncbi:hypothetical protein BGW38_000851 [Lunasporangiospora selenospora]|uniref:SET domain-containing protein n=1 Tax=Lunasporangiospora selenospora TaxID=979761 RepID=A0A9P6G2R6_9FUNG|nr:hypothetical protein BGW38_000851 [Lunasporangiospora selenospora]